MKIFELMNQLAKFPAGAEVRASANMDDGQYGDIVTAEVDENSVTLSFNDESKE